MHKRWARCTRVVGTQIHTSSLFGIKPPQLKLCRVELPRIEWILVHFLLGGKQKQPFPQAGTQHIIFLPNDPAPTPTMRTMSSSLPPRSQEASHEAQFLCSQYPRAFQVPTPLTHAGNPVSSSQPIEAHWSWLMHMK